MTKTDHSSRILNAFIRGNISYREALERMQHVCGKAQAARVLNTLSTYTI